MAMPLKISTMYCRLWHKLRKSIKITHQGIIKTSVLKRYPSSL